MGWLIGTIIVLFVILLTAGSPSFRVSLFVVVVIIGAGIWYEIDNKNKSNEKYVQELRERAALNESPSKLIDANQLQVTDLSLKKSSGDYWDLIGTITNNSSYSLWSVDFLVTMTDCPGAGCSTVIREDTTVARFADGVPPGQTRAFSAIIQFRDLPQAGNLAWIWKVTATKAKP